MGNTAVKTILIFAAAVGVVLGIRALTNPGQVEAPSFFQHTTLEAGLEQAEREGKPVFAFATADWCGPCQRFKGSTLADPAIAELITERTVPVYVDVTEGTNGDAATLGVRTIPAGYIIEPGGSMYAMPSMPDSGEMSTWIRSLTN